MAVGGRVPPCTLLRVLVLLRREDLFEKILRVFEHSLGESCQKGRSRVRLSDEEGEDRLRIQMGKGVEDLFRYRGSAVNYNSRHLMAGGLKCVYSVVNVLGQARRVFQR